MPLCIGPMPFDAWSRQAERANCDFDYDCVSGRDGNDCLIVRCHRGWMADHLDSYGVVGKQAGSVGPPDDGVVGQT